MQLILVTFITVLYDTKTSESVIVHILYYCITFVLSHTLDFYKYSVYKKITLKTDSAPGGYDCEHELRVGARRA